jgi:hypothetical protein
MNFPHSQRRPTAKKALALFATCLSLAGICSCINPTFVNTLSGGSVVPLAPGNAKFVHVLVINATATSTLDFQFGWTPTFQGFNSGYVHGIIPSQQRGFLIACPVDQIGLGNPLDLVQPAIVITLSDGRIVDVPASAFPLTLKGGSDFVCGDTVVFTVVDNRTASYGISISAGRIDGQGQTGPFTGPDTFQIVELLLATSGGTTPTPLATAKPAQ